MCWAHAEVAQWSRLELIVICEPLGTVRSLGIDLGAEQQPEAVLRALVLVVGRVLIRQVHADEDAKRRDDEAREPGLRA